jgi:hypothetical protein
MRLSAYDAVIARAARQLRPGFLNEQQWLRHNHADLANQEDWQLRRELRIVSDYLDTEPGQRDWMRSWFVERRQRLLEELRRRRRVTEKPDEQQQSVARQPKQSPAAPASPPVPRTDAVISLPWRGGQQ